LGYPPPGHAGGHPGNGSSRKQRIKMRRLSQVISAAIDAGAIQADEKVGASWEFACYLSFWPDRLFKRNPRRRPYHGHNSLKNKKLLI
jgi:hypothetical protein